MPTEPQSLWRQRARRILIRLLDQAQSEQWSRKDLEKAIFDAYPFGERHYLPYQMWNIEKKLCLRAFDSKTTISRIVAADQAREWAQRGTRSRSEHVVADPNQMEIDL